MGWLIALGILVMIAILPVGVSVIYDLDGFRAAIIAGPIRMPVFPVKKKDKKKKTEKVKQPTQRKKNKPAESKTKTKITGGSIHDFLPVVDRTLDFLSVFRRKIRINNLELKLVLGGGDPSDLAVNYGKGWAILGNMVPLLENAFVVKKRNLEVECDFLAECTTVVAGVDISVTVGRILSLAGIQGIPILWEFLKIINKRKGGAKA